MNKSLTRLLPVLLLALSLPLAASASEKTHRVILQVNDNDADRMNLVLNNASNVIAYYQEKNEPVEVEIVTYGPGLIMLIEGKSPVAERIKSFGQSYDNIGFKACANTRAKMEKKSGKKVMLLSEAKIVPSGVIHAVERQEQGWSYIKP